MKFKRAFKALYEDAKEKYDIQQAPKLILRKDEKNGNGSILKRKFITSRFRR